MKWESNTEDPTFYCIYPPTSNKLVVLRRIHSCNSCASVTVLAFTCSEQLVTHSRNSEQLAGDEPSPRQDTRAKSVWFWNTFAEFLQDLKVIKPHDARCAIKNVNTAPYPNPSQDFHYVNPSIKIVNVDLCPNSSQDFQSTLHNAGRPVTKVISEPHPNPSQELQCKFHDVRCARYQASVQIKLILWLRLQWSPFELLYKAQPLSQTPPCSLKTMWPVPLWILKKDEKGWKRNHCCCKDVQA